MFRGLFKRLLPAALAVLLVAVLVGPSAVTAAEPKAITTSIVIPAGAFIPTTDDWDFFHSEALELKSGHGNFTAAVSFPVAEVTIKRITLYAYDNDPAASVCVILLRARPAAGVEDWVGDVCSVDSASKPAAAYTTALAFQRVRTALQGPYLWASLDGPGLGLYGVKITFSYEA